MNKMKTLKKVKEDIKLETRKFVEIISYLSQEKLNISIEEYVLERSV